MPDEKMIGNEIKVRGAKPRQPRPSVSRPDRVAFGPVQRISIQTLGNAPAVFRPQESKLDAPPVYRPRSVTPIPVQRVPIQTLGSAPAVFRPQEPKLDAPPVYRPRSVTPIPVQRVPIRTLGSAPAVFRPQEPKLDAPSVYRLCSVTPVPAQRSPIQARGSTPPVFTPPRSMPQMVYRSTAGLVGLKLSVASQQASGTFSTPRSGYRSIIGRTAAVQMRARLAPFTNSTVQDQGQPRYRRLRELLDEAPIVLQELKDVRVYEDIHQKAGGWYASLWNELKKAQQWEATNRPKNAHVEIIVPDEIYLLLAEMCVGYRRELNDSYAKFRRTILDQDAGLREKYKPLDEEDVEDDDDPNPLSVPKVLYRWVSTEEAKRASKEGITYDANGGGIPTSTKGSIGVAITSGAVVTDKCLVIITSKIPNFKFEYVPTRSKLKEVKVKCNIPADAIQ